MKSVALLVASVILAAPALPQHAGASIGAPQAHAVQADPLPFIITLSQHVVHGDRDDRLSHAELVERLRKGDLVLTCGPSTDFVRVELERAGVRARNVQLRAPLPHNGYDDGHVLLEVETRTGNILVDVDLKRLFLIDGKPASIEEIRARGFGAVRLKALPIPARVDPAFSLAAYERAILANPRSWYAKMFAGNVGAPAIAHERLAASFRSAFQ